MGEKTVYYVELYDEKTGEWARRPFYYRTLDEAKIAAEQESKWWGKSWRVASVSTTYTYEEGFLPIPGRWHSDTKENE